MERTIRSEQPNDDAMISNVVIRAYLDVSYSDHREYVMIEWLRRTDDYNPELSLLAEITARPSAMSC